MSAAKKQNKLYPGTPGVAGNSGKQTGKQENLRANKMETEKLRDKLQSNIMDNPKAAKKAALLLSLWIDGKVKHRKK